MTKAGQCCLDPGREYGKEETLRNLGALGAGAVVGGSRREARLSLGFAGGTFVTGICHIVPEACTSHPLHVCSSELVGYTSGL